MKNGWPIKKLADVAESISTGPFRTMLHKADYVPVGIPLVNPVNMIDAQIVPSGKMMINEETRNRLSPYVLRNGRVLAFHIPSRPLGTAFQYEGAYLMRAGEELVSMSEDRLRGIFAEGQPDWLSQSAKTDASEDEVVSLLDTQTYFDLMKLPYPTDRKGVLDRLASEQLARVFIRWT